MLHKILSVDRIFWIGVADLPRRTINGPIPMALTKPTVSTWRIKKLRHGSLLGDDGTWQTEVFRSPLLNDFRFGTGRKDAHSQDLSNALRKLLPEGYPKDGPRLTFGDGRMPWVEWDVIEKMPCVIRLVPIPKPSASFYDFDDFERLVEAAEEDGQTKLVVLLGGEAGLRCGEIMALEWSDVDFTKRQLCVARSDWKGHVTVPKGGRQRHVPVTKRLQAALRAARHLRGPRVLCDDDGKPLTQKIVQVMMRRVARRANVKAGVHILRHTFCSHLAMRGAPARAIQELAGHEDLATTQRYMHLSPAAIESAIRLLDMPGTGAGRGNRGEAATGEIAK